MIIFSLYQTWGGCERQNFISNTKLDMQCVKGKNVINGVFCAMTIGFQNMYCILIVHVIASLLHLNSFSFCFKWCHFVEDHILWKLELFLSFFFSYIHFFCISHFLTYPFWKKTCSWMTRIDNDKILHWMPNRYLLMVT